MPRRTIGSIVGAFAALLALALLAPLAQAGAPATVTVRVEAPGRTLAARTVTTTRRAVVKDGNPAHACTGTSAAGALQLATGGRWSGIWNDGLGYMVDAIGGVRAPADFSAYWALWVNGRSSNTGVCDTELDPGDQVLQFLCTSTPDFSGCVNQPLALRVVRVRGAVATVDVVRLSGDGTSAPAAGAIVSGGEHPARAAADGRARVTLVTAQATLRATRRGDVPSAPLHCRLGARGGASCGSRDRTPPVLAVRGLRDGQVLAAARAPRTLSGTARDPQGVEVSLQLTRTAAGRCAVFQPARGAFVACRGPRPWALVGDRASWSYLLPARLGPGAYVLTVRATDPAGNASRKRVRFAVEG